MIGLLIPLCRHKLYCTFGKAVIENIEDGKGDWKRQTSPLAMTRPSFAGHAILVISPGHDGWTLSFSTAYILVYFTVNRDTRVPADPTTLLTMYSRVWEERPIERWTMAAQSRLRMVLTSLVETLHGSVPRVSLAPVVHDAHGRITAHGKWFPSRCRGKLCHAATSQRCIM
jgi:hypothetical protein